MSQSSLVTRQWWANESNYTKGRTDTIHGIVIHHAASTSLDSVGQAFSQWGRNGSAHYGVCGTQIHQYVREEDCAWHCGDWAGNNCTIGIETVNSTGAPTWLVSEESFNTLAKLCADIAKRNGLGRVKFGPDDVYPTLSAHRDWSATYCPGDYLYNRMNELANRINEINYPSKPRLEYTKFEKAVTYITTRDTHLYDFGYSKASDLVQIKNYAKGDKIDIYAKCENVSIGKTFLMTEYSYAKGLTNGFKEDAMEVYKAPEPAPEPTPEPVPSGDGDPDNPRGMSDEDYKKFLKDLEKIQKKAKEEKAMIPMSNKTYDILKIVAIVILPLVQALYVGLSKIWGFGFGTEIDQTIQLIVAAINTILGVALVKSSSDYHKDK